LASYDKSLDISLNEISGLHWRDYDQEGITGRTVWNGSDELEDCRNRVSGEAVQLLFD